MKLLDSHLEDTHNESDSKTSIWNRFHYDRSAVLIEIMIIGGRAAWVSQRTPRRTLSQIFKENGASKKASG